MNVVGIDYNSASKVAQSIDLIALRIREVELLIRTCKLYNMSEFTVNCLLADEFDCKVADIKKVRASIEVLTKQKVDMS